jgi:deoxyxylulose-5-phosphate synthase
MQFGLPDRFIEQASQSAQLHAAGLSAERITGQIRSALQA